MSIAPQSRHKSKAGNQKINQFSHNKGGKMNTPTKGDLVKSLGIDKETFDYALPLHWVYDTQSFTNINPIPHFVWLYDKTAKIFGRPYPLTIAGWIILKMLKRQGHPDYGFYKFEEDR